MSSCYVSPIPARIVPDFGKRREGVPILRRLHHYPRHGGGVSLCEPRLCRECQKETRCRHG